MKVIAIDPSLNSLGWAAINSREEGKGGGLQGSGVVKAPKVIQQKSLDERLIWMLFTLAHEIVVQWCDKLVIEQPESWGAYKSMASAHSGGLLSLHILTGALFAWALSIAGAGKVELVKVSKWKGQLPKRVTKKRMESKYGVKFATDDESDAVGIADWRIEQERRKNGAAKRHRVPQER